MSNSVSLFGLKFSTKVYEEGRDGFIIMGDLSLGNKKIAKAFDDGHGGQMEFDLYVPHDVWESINNKVSDTYVKLGVFDKPPLEPMAHVVEDLINLEAAQKYFKDISKKNKIKKPIITVFVEQQEYWKAISSICSNRPLTATEIGEKAVSVIGSSSLSKMNVLSTVLENDFKAISR